MVKTAHGAWMLAPAILSLALASQTAVADTGSAAFDRYVQDVHLRMRAIDNGSNGVSTPVDQGAFERYVSAIGQSAGGPGLNDTAVFLASLQVTPLRTFDAYLAYLGKRMRADAGSPGPLLANHRGTGPFDRYIEEINYRLQTLYQAEESTGF